MAPNDTVVVRRSGDPVDEAAGGHWNAGSGIEICSTVAPPCSRDDNAEAIGGVAVRRARRITSCIIPET